MAKGRVKSLAFRFHTDSSAWAKVSKAVSRVKDSGQRSVSEGSIKAWSGKPKGEDQERLSGGVMSKSHKVAQGVTSLPVPDVVGAHHKV
jgi:hypothetical protein